MKKLVIIATAFLLMAGYAVNAQNGTQPHPHIKNQDQEQSMTMPKNGKTQEMMSNGVCDHMMDQNKSMKKHGMMLNKLPEMQQELSLNNNQIEELKDLQARLKKQMQDFINTKVSMNAATYKTVEKMEAVLTTEQKEQLKTKMMQQEDRMNLEKDGRLQSGD